MANKTTTNLKSQEQSARTAVQSQLARIKIQEEEELWISGEELYTEGSSDEEDYKTKSRSRRKINSNQSSRASSANHSLERRRSRSPLSSESKTRLIHSADSSINSITKKQTVSKTTSKFDKPSASFEQLAGPSSAESHEVQRFSIPQSSDVCIAKDDNFSDLYTEDDEVENTEISWKAKRGSFVLHDTSNAAKEESNKC
ncbi:uncharacterized protein LOC128894146 [Hylaeus anthracinus]|uniref:uncharacterized protein LOC128894146 n=1 Tax=Hylaeus anthracinus TaxID=313031 RepID=UPI0023B8D1A8|nr:uncharacterized protein LOC128894146 [Hylaeus anthracinus]